MGLIDADELKKELYQQWFMDILLTQRNSEDMFYALAQKIDAQPTAYDVDKVVEKLEKRRMDALRHLRENKGTEFGYASECVYNALNEAVEIVEGGGVDG